MLEDMRLCGLAPKTREAYVGAVRQLKRHPAWRWVVERTLSWQNDFRSLRTRWAKKADSWLGFLCFASALVL